MDTVTAADMMRELAISKSYLYKLVEREHLAIRKSETGRYLWTADTLRTLKALLDTECREEKENALTLMAKWGLKPIFIQNRRYLGNKYALSRFIRDVVDENCRGVNIVADVFSGTGAVANVFKDKMLITNDLLYSNYLSNYAWFFGEPYSLRKVMQMLKAYNAVATEENNYMRQNFADTFFSAVDCSKIGYIREDIEQKHRQGAINFKEYAILITSLLYAMDKIANTVGHYDAYRRYAPFDKALVLHAPFTERNLNPNNACYHRDANALMPEVSCDLLYLDPPYNSRQYCDAYHLMENVALWQKPEVYGVARKMDRTSLKSAYCLHSAAQAFADLVEKADAKYILLSYNNMSDKGNDRSNAKIADADILRILRKKGRVTVFEADYRSFSTGKSDIRDHKERLFLCETYPVVRQKTYISCPFNYTGGKFKLLPQMQSYFKAADVFFDVFAGGGNVGVNSTASKVILNDINEPLMDVIRYIKNTPVDTLLRRLDQRIRQYQLSDTSRYGYEFYGGNSSVGLAAYNKEKFLQVRDAYNRSVRAGKADADLLYLLIVYAFNNQIRFNRKGEFNLPVGKRDFNANMRRKLSLFANALNRKDVVLQSVDFRRLSLDDLPRHTFLYCDPPYLITDATYNENGAWTEAEERALLEFLDQADAKGFSFALSNVLQSQHRENLLLKEWIGAQGYRCHRLDKSYANSNYHRKDRGSVSQEVLITNYDVSGGSHDA